MVKGFKDSTRMQHVAGPDAKSGAAGAAKQSAMFSTHKKGPQGSPMAFKGKPFHRS